MRAERSLQLQRRQRGVGCGPRSPRVRQRRLQRKLLLHPGGYLDCRRSRRSRGSRMLGGGVAAGPGRGLPAAAASWRVAFATQTGQL
jgi:hypothetical protein